MQCRGMQTTDTNYQEQFLLPPSIEEWVASDHPARFIREIVYHLDLKGLGVAMPECRTGRPSYSIQLLFRGNLEGGKCPKREKGRASIGLSEFRLPHKRGSSSHFSIMRRAGTRF